MLDLCDLFTALEDGKVNLPPTEEDDYSEEAFVS